MVHPYIHILNDFSTCIHTGASSGKDMEVRSSKECSDGTGLSLPHQSSWKSWRHLRRDAMWLLCFQPAMGRACASLVRRLYLIEAADKPELLVTSTRWRKIHCLLIADGCHIRCDNIYPDAVTIIVNPRGRLSHKPGLTYLLHASPMQRLQTTTPQGEPTLFLGKTLRRYSACERHFCGCQLPDSGLW